MEDNIIPERPYGKRTRNGKRMGRKPTKPPIPPKEIKVERKHRSRTISDDNLVRKAIVGMARRKYTYDQIADTLGVSKSWLRENYGHEIKAGREIADALVVENLYAQAMKDTPASIQAGMYITKTQMGWRDKQDDEYNRAPQVIFDFSGLSYEERGLLMDKLRNKSLSPADTIEGEIVDADE
jgi:hypothetical protein